ncbi:MAG: VanZ family protein [Clostridia bacterium]|nr:VanZ family protein [Clostridia bacterium]
MDFGGAVRFFVDTAWDFVLDMLLPMLAAAIIFFLTASSRKRRLAGAGQRSGKAREAVLFIFVLFCTGLAALTMTPPNFFCSLRDGSVPVLAAPFSGGVNLVPTVFNPNTWDGLWQLFMNLANIGMFLPLGLFPALLWDRPRWWRAVLVGGGSSLLVEAVQLLIGRATDVDDLILNTLGALCGYWLYLLLRRLMPKALSKLRCERQETPYGPKTGNRTTHP